MSELVLRWGLLSTARINRRVIGAIEETDRSVIAAVASRDGSRAAEYAKTHGIPHWYGSYQEMLAAPDIDVVYVSLPNAMHVEWGMRAAEAGKHVLIEKPIALDPRDVVGLEAIANDKGVVIQEASMMRFHPQTSLLRDLVASGVIGEPRWAHGAACFSMSGSGDIRLDPDGGGSLWDLGTYPVTLFNAVLGRRPLEVSALARVGTTGVDLTFAGQIRYEGDVLGSFATSMETWPSNNAEFAGSTGVITVEDPWLFPIGVGASGRVTIRTSSDAEGSTSHRSVADANAYVEEVTAMESMILDGANEVFPLRESATNIATLTALLKSASSGRVVSVD
ncbi:MAG: hypothetical protein GEU79_08285 [Acidimicrobiia bacterium]|nr:hypothetical protein [Acidimicrobiia bacterium]